MSVTEKETKQQEGTCTAGACSTDKEKSVQVAKVAKVSEVSASVDKTEKKNHSCCG